ncbi:MAG: hypothetical protein JO061_24830 [Acidobacteriaceae bacterium]|nr:hypothetical protein [Acidobacteriaceae bacterium]
MDHGIRWTDDEIRRVQLMQRYKTTDEDSYYKALRAIESMKRTHDQEVRKAKRDFRADVRGVRAEVWLAPAERNPSPLVRRG